VFQTERMQQAADSPFAAATDLAELLVERGTPFREAHALVGALVRDSLERHVPLAELVEAHPDLGAEGAALLEPGVPVARRRTAGGAGPDPVAAQIERLRRRLDADAQRIG
jgi:argininosuccinate lyase